MAFSRLAYRSISLLPGTESDSSEEEPILWQKFHKAPPIPGFKENVVLCFSEFPDSDDAQRDDLDLSSEESANRSFLPNIRKNAQRKLVAQTLKYLLLNGLEKVQAVSNFAEYVDSIADEVNSENNELDVKTERTDVLGDADLKEGRDPDSLDVSVICLLPCKGRFHEKKMWELVSDAFKVSKLGVIFIAHSSVIEKGPIFDNDWKDFVNCITNGSHAIRDHLEIVCRNHKLKNENIFTAEDLKKWSPLGGCLVPCGDMECGHYCSKPCHPSDRNHITEEFRCDRRCKRECPKGHRCKNVCWEDCGICEKILDIYGDCEHTVGNFRQAFCYEPEKLCEITTWKTLLCGHYRVAVPCFKDISEVKCDLVLGGELACGHTLIFPCSQDKPDLDHPCQLPVLRKFECGHEIGIACSENLDTLTCSLPCNKPLNCGHVCSQKCHLDDPDHEAYQCTEPCQKYCARGYHKCPGEHPCHEPCGPCGQDYFIMMECEHIFKTICSEDDPDFTDYVCHEPCRMFNLFCKHFCPKQCWEPCGKCERIVSKRVLGCPRGHYVRVKCHEPLHTRCYEKVAPRAIPDCGHQMYVDCQVADTITKEELEILCPEPCTHKFDVDKECGHECQGTCGDCFQGRFHRRCGEPCGKMLICGHSCTSPCPATCPPCRYPCVVGCEHDKCKFECGVPCEWKCEEPCLYKCDHSACTQKCSEICDKPVCSEPCTKLLECGHPCVGICGEPCPPFCRLCTPEKLLPGTFSGDTELNPDDKFVFLPDCGHCVEITALENWLNQKSDEILPLRCPICVTRIPWIRRYSALFHENLQMVNSVREKIFGSRQDIEKIILEMQKKIIEHGLATNGKFHITGYLEYFLEEFTKGSQNPDLEGIYFKTLYLDKVQFLRWMCDQWLTCSKRLFELESNLPSIAFGRLLSFCEEYFNDMAWYRFWPMYSHETRDLMREWQRMEDTVALYSRLDATKSRAVGQVMGSDEGRRLFSAVEVVVRENVPYLGQNRERFLAHLTELDAALHTTLQLTETERVEIVQAFGEASGRWFKCVNGHVYVVTECGGATEMGTCNECGAQIGGANHVLAEQNYLASEMDGARAPLYPTVLDRN